LSDAGENLFGPADVAEQVGAVRRTTSTTTMRGVLAKRFNRLMKKQVWRADLLGSSSFWAC